MYLYRDVEKCRDIGRRRKRERERERLLRIYVPSMRMDWEGK